MNDSMNSAAVSGKAPHGTTANPYLESALSIARVHRLPIFPCKPDKSPLITGWQERATTDEGTIRGWWSEWPFALIGSPTGARSGRWVVDPDAKHGVDGVQSFEELCAGKEPVAETTSILTPSGGKHLWFQWPDSGLEIRNSTSRIAEGVDVRGEGGYAIVPAEGSGYVWEREIPMQRAPAWLEELAFEVNPGRATPEAAAEEVVGEAVDVRVWGIEPIPRGERNSTLNKRGFALRVLKGASEAVIREQLHDVNQRLCRPPLPDHEVEGIIRSVVKEPARIAPEEVEPPAPEAGAGTGVDTGGDAMEGLSRDDQAMEHEKARIKIYPGDVTSTVRLVQRALNEDFDYLDPVVSAGGIPVAVRVQPSTVQIGVEGKPLPPQLRFVPLTPPTMTMRILERTMLLARNSKGEFNPVTYVPNQLRDIVYGETDRLRPCSGIAYAPVFLPDGTLVTQPGYSPELQLWVHPPEGFDVDRVTRATLEDAKRSLAWLRETYLAGFPFASPGDRDAAVAGLMTALCRRTLPIAPGLLINGVDRAVGKTTLAAMIGLGVFGKHLPMFTLAKDEIELEKLVGSALLEGHPGLLFDNVRANTMVDSSVLAKITTAHVAGMRILGASSTKTLSTQSWLVMTGNGIGLNEDLSGRFLVVDLELPPGIEHAAHYRRNRRDDPLHIDNRKRVELLEHLCVLIGAYINSPLWRAEKEMVDVLLGAQPTTRYAAWDQLVRLPLVYAGGRDMARRLEETIEESTPREQETDVLVALSRLMGVEPFTSAGLYNQLLAGSELSMEALDAVETYYPGAAGKKSRLGYVLRQLKSKTRGGVTLRPLGYAHKKMRRYKIETE